MYIVFDTDEYVLGSKLMGSVYFLVLHCVTLDTTKALAPDIKVFLKQVV